ncbi:NAD/FAD-dependent oxidoreductase [Haladaptatus sp. R4]|uniref:NAD(P)/FAD-dependent oxidoreductase n=1 Tax=Haladaptatus sp. R4 TaxID=1679489 RepID=UPI0007B483DE|nr:FAD-dependent oxidoreductase [Haladaptatus sp. R4]KZN25995.1 NAD/FAD-dependent oxidoreductase [Haladaptatus sp. R4]
MTRVAVVGAGVAGLGVAFALRDDADVTLFERTERVGGRATSHERNRCVYDVGANYVKSDDERVSELVRELDEGLVETEGPVWTFDADEAISEGRDEDDSKWTYRTGLRTLGTRLADASGATVHTDTRITGLRRAESSDAESWYVEDEDGDEYGPWDALVLTPPAPVTASLLDLAEWDDDLRRELREAIGHVPYRPVLSVALHYSFEVERPYVRAGEHDKEHEVGWLSRESCKPGHVPEGEELLIVQLSPEWSADHYDDDDFGVATAAAGYAADLLSEHPFAAPDWFDVVRWRDAQPNDGVDEAVLRRANEAGLFFAGDWVVGEGRVHRALRSGLDAAEEILD